MVPGYICRDRIRPAGVCVEDGFGQGVSKILEKHLNQVSRKAAALYEVIKGEQQSHEWTARHKAVGYCATVVITQEEVGLRIRMLSFRGKMQRDMEETQQHLWWVV